MLNLFPVSTFLRFENMKKLLGERQEEYSAFESNSNPSYCYFTIVFIDFLYDRDETEEVAFQ